MMVYENAKMFMIVYKTIKNSNSNSNNKAQANIKPSWPNKLSKERLIFVIQYKSLDLILIKRNWFYLSPLGEKANCEGAFSFWQIEI